MDAEKAIRMIDEYLAEPNSIHRVWSECLQLCRQALEKQIPKKLIKKHPICYSKSKDGEELYAYDVHCPQCDAKVNSERHHCPCGQALDWSDTE